MPRLAGLSALDDQAAAGVLMWVPGSVAFLLPLFGIGVRLLSGRGASVRSDEVGGRSQRPAVAKPGGQVPLPGRIALPVLILRLSLVALADVQPLAFDLLRLPLLGRFLRWRHARLCLQVPLLLLAGVMIYDGLRGPPGRRHEPGRRTAVDSLARPAWSSGLLAAGNVFCMACPFMVPRTLARRWLPQGRSWPRWLRNKWLAVVLLAVFLWAYEAFALWDSPWWTAWIALGYFVGGLRHRWFLSRCIAFASMSARSASSTSCSR